MNKHSTILSGIICLILNVHHALAQPITAGLTAHYAFNGNANDASSNALHGTLNGATPTTDRFGNANSAYSFDGVNDFISVPDNDSLDIGTHDYTLVAWIKTASTNAGRIFSKGSSGFSTGYMMRTTSASNSKILLESSSNGSGIFGVTGSTTINNNTWHCVVGVVKRNAYARVYVDGILNAEDLTNISASNLSNNLSLRFGANNVASPAEFFSGSIDDISIFNRALTVQEITTISNASVQTGDNCSNAIDLATLTSPFTGTTVGFADDVNSNTTCLSSAPDRYFFIDVPVGQTLQIGQSDNSYDSKHQIAFGGACPGQTLITCWDDADFEVTNWTNSTGATQRVWWIQDGYNGGMGSFTLDWSFLMPPPNDNCTGATPFPTIPADGTCATLQGSTVSATSSLAACVGTADDDVWFSFVAPSSTVLTVLTTIDGASDRVHQVFSGTCSNLTGILCSDAESNTITGLTVGQTYYIRVYTYGSAVNGDFNLCLKAAPPPPANDLCANAIQISCGQTISGTTVNATADAVPCAAASTSALGVWYKITGNGSDVTASLCATDFDNQIAVFSGNCNSLTCEAGNDDACCTACGGQVTFPTVAGTTYYLWVTGFNSAVGNFELSVDCATTFNSDLAVTALLSPIPACAFPGQQTVQIEVKNFGLVSQSNYQIGYRVNSGSNITQPINQPIGPGETKTYTFTATTTLTAGNNTVRAWTKLTGDQNVFNDTLTTTVNQLTFNATTYAATTTPICEGDDTWLYSTGGEQYLWSDGSSASFHYVSPATTTTYIVTVTGADPNCVDVDTVTVVVTPAPTQPSISATSSIICSGSNVTLTSSITTNIQWYPGGQTTPTITVTQPGTYYVRHFATGTSNCYTWSEPFQVQLSSPPCLYASGDAVICSNETETLYLSCLGGLQWTYLWSSGQTTNSIAVSPDVTTTYSVTATNNYGCAFVLSKTVQVLSNAQPVTPVNLLPPNGAANVPNPVVLSWSASANASQYEVFIWQGATMPNDPDGSTTQITYTKYGLTFGQTYKWCVRAVNNCTGAISPHSAVQTFTLSYLPDLVVLGEPSPPDTAFSGTEIEMDWTVLNNTTLAATSSGVWYDAVYLSTDSLLSNDDLFLGYKVRPNALVANSTYGSSMDAQLPEGLFGDYCILVRADAYNYEQEADETNNVSACGRLHIRLTPPPDLFVDSLTLSGVANGTVFQGATIGVEWTVANRYNSDDLSGQTISGSWYDRVGYSADSLNPNGMTWVASFPHSGNLNVSENYSKGTSITFPSWLTGTRYIWVCTDAWDNEYEHIFENNNCRCTEAVNILPTAKPDFTVFDVEAPGILSNKEPFTIQWKGQNNGAPFPNGAPASSGFLTDGILLNDTPDLTTPLATLGSLGASRNLPGLGETYDAEKNLLAPNVPPGNYYLVVRANTGGVPEDSLADNFAAVPVEIRSPNLTVPAIATPTAALAGQPITVQWWVKNTGNGKLTNCPVTDRIRLFDNPSASGNPLAVGSLSSSLTLLPGDSILRQQTLTLPNGLSGTVCVEVVTNYNQAAYEAGMYGDNQLISPTCISVTLPDYPNLTNVQVTPGALAAMAGSGFSLNYQVQNTGDAAVLGNWQDHVYLSTSTVPGQGQSWFLQPKNQSQVVAAGGGYSQTATVQLPSWLPSGNYYLCVAADGANSIYEYLSENDNTGCSAAIAVTELPDVDLAVTQGEVSGNATPGGTLTLTWTVENVGTTPTLAGAWTDAVYLSQDMLFTPGSDILVQQWQRTGDLPEGGMYTRSETFTIPAGLPSPGSTWFLFIVADHDTLTNDNNFNNNYLKITQVGNGGTIIITFPPKPDLQPEQPLIAPAQGTAGQLIPVSFTIKNNSSSVAIGTWNDAVILSTDLVVGNAGDIVLKQWQKTGPVAINGSYSINGSVLLPASASGNYLLLLKSDHSGLVLESDENNNVISTPLFVLQPAPADLVPFNVSAPSVDTIATQMTVNWQLANNGQNLVSGNVQEGVYLSTDTIWDAGDLLFATLNSFIGLDPGASADRSVTARLEDVSRQDYFVLVKTDQLNQFPEDNEGNNCALSPVPVFVEVPALPYDIPTSATLELEKPGAYFRLEVPANFAGETMRLTLSGNDASAFNELYLRYGEMASRSEHDFTFSTPFDEDQEILVPALDSGTYYVMAYPVEGSAQQTVTLHWKIIPFSLTSIEANQGGNNGNVTVKIRGAKFEPGMAVWLEDGGNLIAGENLFLLNPLEAFVTFPLDGEALGLYDVKAQNAAGTVAVLTDSFEVIGGTIIVDPLLTCTINGQGIFNLNALDPVSYEVQHPPFARPNQVVAITLRFENTGTVDVPAPQRVFAGLNGFPLSPAVDNLGDNMAELPLIFTEDDGPPGILRPGGVALQTVYTKAVQATGAMMFKLF